MAIKFYCSECEAQLVDGVMKHKKGCSAWIFVLQTGTGLRPPSTVIKFDTPEEQAKFMENLAQPESGGDV